MFRKIIASCKVKSKSSVKLNCAPYETVTLSQSSQAIVADLLKLMNSDVGGLSETEAANRFKEYGANEIARKKAPAWYIQFIHAFINPFNGILLFVSIISLVTDVIMAARPKDQSFKTIIVLSAMILVSTILRFWQEFQSNRAAERLKAMVHTTTAVLRQGMKKAQEIPIINLVPGDIIKLGAGDMIPADVRLITAKDLFVSQSALTGEALPVEKHEKIATGLENNISSVKTKNRLDLSNVCFMGTNVVSGAATAMVIATGDHTYFGSIAKELASKRPPTSFDRGINKVSWILIRFMCIMVPVVFVINGLDKGDWLEALLFSVSVAVGLTPEMLPTIVTANLARGASVLAKRKTIVKHLNAIQNFGAMDILCTDKTGTLTQDKIILERHLDIYGNNNIQVLEYAYLNSYHQTGLQNLLDVAVLEFGDINQLSHLQQDYKKIDEIPFDFARRRMSVVVADKEGRHLLVCKGAMEEILNICNTVSENITSAQNSTSANIAASENISSFSPSFPDKVTNITRQLNNEGLRVLAVAYKWLEQPGQNYSYNVKDESNLTLAGYVAFLDPPKETAYAAIKALQEYGVTVKIITGDNDIVTRKICNDVGLPSDQILLGEMAEKMNDIELGIVAEYTNIFAKMAPLQKSRVIKVLQSRNHTVGYLGDGINDAAALKQADVGISVDSAVDIAKESADIILLEKSLMVLQEGVREGRKTFGNIIKYIKMTASSNFGNVFSVLIASAFLPFLPMLPLQLLIQNLLYDISQTSIPWDQMDEDYLAKPRKWEAGGLVRFMIFVGPISSIFDIATFYLMWHFFGASSVEQQSLFQSGWFIEGLLSQTLIVHMIRTQKIPFLQSIAATPVLLLTSAIMIIGIAIPFTSFGANVGLKSLPLIYFLWLTITLLGYCILTQIIKQWYMKRFKQWL
jgi:Mg2+-importing ATPase